MILPLEWDVVEYFRIDIMKQTQSDSLIRLSSEHFSTFGSYFSFNSGRCIQTIPSNIQQSKRLVITYIYFKLRNRYKNTNTHTHMKRKAGEALVWFSLLLHIIYSIGQLLCVHHRKKKKTKNNQIVKCSASLIAHTLDVCASQTILSFRSVDVVQIRHLL